MEKRLFSLGEFDFDNIPDFQDMPLESIPKKDIAVVGISCVFAGAKNTEEYWNMLRSGKDGIRSIPECRKQDVESFIQREGMIRGTPEYVDYAYMDEIDKFDPGFFSISPREASFMDPNQRMFLETAWKVIENAGYGGIRLHGTRTGVYVGYASNAMFDYRHTILSVDPSMLSFSMPANLRSIIASRISYLLNLKGPAVNIDTACSSSLTAIHYACRDLRNGTCDYAIAGSININFSPLKFSSDEGIGIQSKDGRTRTFDDSSSGTGGGEGTAAVLLKPLSKAILDGDNIYAVIKGSAVNQDGASVGITAPNSSAQEDVIDGAWKDAGVTPETLAYIEAHGTGTKLGDPIEIEGIRRAFGRYTSRKQFCAIGSAKTNIGHLNSAAGIAGFIKAVLAIKHAEIPPSIHFQKPNREIPFEDSPVYVNDRATEWKTTGFPRRCGVSSFGLSGTNCHIVLEEALSGHTAAESEGIKILVLSAKSINSLMRLVKEYSIFLSSKDLPNLEDICYTASTGRGHYSHRLAILFHAAKELESSLNMLYLSDLNTIDMDYIMYGVNHPVLTLKKDKEPGEITLDEKAAMDKEAAEVLNQFAALKEKNRNEDSCTNALKQLGFLYIRGADILWDKLYRLSGRKRVSLPVYPFERERYWIDIDNHTADEKYTYHTIRWKRDKLDTMDKMNIGQAVILIFKDDCGISNGVAAMLKNCGANVIEVEIGPVFSRTARRSYFITGESSEYEELLSDLKDYNISSILHFISITDKKEVDSLQTLEDAQRRGMNSLFYLTQALLNNKYNREINIYLISEFVNEITGEEKRINPENATLFGLGKVVSQEYPKIKCRCIDIDDRVSADDLLAEITAAHDRNTAAYRDGSRYVEILDTLKISGEADESIQYRSDGVYIITGGLGGIGFETAKHLMAQNHINLALLGRSALPDPSEWDAILKENKDLKLIHRIKSMKEFEKEGSKVVYYSVDVSDMDIMEQVIDELRKKFGRINGIIHSAGVAGDGFIIHKSKKELNNVIKPKVYGTWILDRLTRADRPDFFVLHSALTSIAGAPGQGDYTAANSYLDSFAAYRNKSGFKTLAINWAAWSETGMAFNYKAVSEDSIFKPLNTSEALEQFDEVLNSKAGRALIGKINAEVWRALDDNSRLPISDSVRKELGNNRNSKTSGQPTGKEHLKAVKITGNQKAGYTPTQQKLAGLWSEVLGWKEVSIYDDFHKLGGDSIVATRLMKLLDGQFPGLLNIADIFAFPTISEMAEYIDKVEGQKINHDSNSVDDILENLESGDLSVDDAVKLTGHGGNAVWKK